jgi:hypothetical protein
MRQLRQLATCGAIVQQHLSPRLGMLQRCWVLQGPWQVTHGCWHSAAACPSAPLTYAPGCKQLGVTSLVAKAARVATTGHQPCVAVDAKLEACSAHGSQVGCDACGVCETS